MTDNFYQELKKLTDNAYQYIGVTNVLNLIGLGLDFWLYGGRLSPGTLPADYDLEPISDSPDINNNFIDIPLPAINKIKPEPRTIYPDPTAPPSINPQIDPPAYPVSPYSSPPSTVGTSPNQEYVVTLAEPLYRRKFGCLLPKPFINQDVDWCIYDDPADVSNFWDQLFTDMENILNTVITNQSVGLACTLATTTLPLPFLQKALLMLGCEVLFDIGLYYRNRNKTIDNYPSTGLLNTGNINLVQCPQPKEPLQYDDWQQDIENNLGIPLHTYDENLGHKPDQIQIVWRNIDPAVKREKITTFPMCIDVNNLDLALLTNNLPATFFFGQVKVILKFKNPFVTGLQSSVVYTHIFIDANTDNDVQTFITTTYEQWRSAFCPDSIIDNVSIHRRPPNNPWKNIISGTFYPRYAHYLTKQVDANNNDSWRRIKSIKIMNNPVTP